MTQESAAPASTADLGTVSHWYLNMLPDDTLPGSAMVALTAAELEEQAPGTISRIGFHSAMEYPIPRAGRLTVRLPDYRGKSFTDVLSWLLTNRLSEPEAAVSWLLAKQQGPKSFAAYLARLGWRDVASAREGVLTWITGVVPRTAELPTPRAYKTVIGEQELFFEADYGLFSIERVDDGTRLLAEVALQSPPVDVVADIGVGYGALAIGLVRNGVARRAAGTDVNCVALWLAKRNAAANRVQLTVTGSSDPSAAEDAELTVCNVPTHIDAAKTADLMRSLARRARGGRRLLIVVHASLEARYTGHLRRNGLTPVAHRGSAHVVLDAVGR